MSVICSSATNYLDANIRISGCTPTCGNRHCKQL